MTKKKKEYYEKKIIVEVPEDTESVTTTTDEEVKVVYAEDPDPTLVRLTSLEERVESIEKEEFLTVRVEDLEREVVDLRSELEGHAQHLPTVSSRTTPRRHSTYVVKEDGERLVMIAKTNLGNSGRHVEICALNNILSTTELKKGQILKMPQA